MTREKPIECKAHSFNFNLIGQLHNIFDLSDLDQNVQDMGFYFHSFSYYMLTIFKSCNKSSFMKSRLHYTFKSLGKKANLIISKI